MLEQLDRIDIVAASEGGKVLIISDGAPNPNPAAKRQLLMEKLRVYAETISSGALDEQGVYRMNFRIVVYVSRPFGDRYEGIDFVVARDTVGAPILIPVTIELQEDRLQTTLELEQPHTLRFC